MKDSFNKNPRPEEVDTFIRAAGQGDNAAVKAFANKYPQSLDALKFRTYVRQTALMAAAASGRKETVELLLARGASVDGKNEQGRTALAYAASSGETEIVDLLLKNGAKIDAGKGNHLAGGWTVLMGAVWHRHVDTVELLIKNGASVSEKDDSGATVIHQVQKKLDQLLTDPLIKEDVRDEWLEKTQQILEILEKALKAETAAPKRLPVKKFRF